MQCPRTAGTPAQEKTQKGGKKREKKGRGTSIACGTISIPLAPTMIVHSQYRVVHAAGLPGSSCWMQLASTSGAPFNPENLDAGIVRTAKLQREKNHEKERSKTRAHASTAGGVPKAGGQGLRGNPRGGSKRLGGEVFVVVHRLAIQWPFFGLFGLFLFARRT